MVLMINSSETIIFSRYHKRFKMYAPWNALCCIINCQALISIIRDLKKELRSKFLLHNFLLKYGFSGYIL